MVEKNVASKKRRLGRKDDIKWGRGSKKVIPVTFSN